MLMIASSAYADDVDALKDRYYENAAGCRQAEINGKPISKDEMAKACKQRDRVALILKSAGQCWDADEQVWRKCQ